MSKVIVHTDGGARGNPGPAAIGVVIEGLKAGKFFFGSYLGKTTNNEAEYRALIEALKKIKESKDDSIEKIDCYADSELMVRQLNGLYKVKDTNIRSFFVEINSLCAELVVPISFNYIPRSENTEADSVVNEILDEESQKGLV